MPPRWPAFERKPVIEAYKRDVDMTLVRENLRRTPEERLNRLMELQAFADELKRAGASLRSSNTKRGSPP